MQLIVGTIRLPAEKSVRSASAMRMMADASRAEDRCLRVHLCGRRSRPWPHSREGALARSGGSRSPFPGCAPRSMARRLAAAGRRWSRPAGVWGRRTALDL